MPEGDTLWRTAAALRERIAGQVCQGVRPGGFGRLVGQTVTGVDAVGKHLFIRFDSGLSLHSHLRMHGSWHVYRRGERWRRPQREVKVGLEFGEWIAVLFGAPVCELVADDTRVTHLGQDILADAFDEGAVLRLARAEGDRPIGEMLLDQRVCAGIGNIYKCEILFTLRIHPWTSVSSLDNPTLTRLYRAARRTMRESAYGIAGRRHNVHARAGKSCHRCGHRIEVKPQGGQARLTYWCPYCQGVQG